MSSSSIALTSVRTVVEPMTIEDLGTEIVPKKAASSSTRWISATAWRCNLHRVESERRRDSIYDGGRRIVSQRSFVTELFWIVRDGLCFCAGLVTPWTGTESVTT